MPDLSSPQIRYFSTPPEGVSLRVEDIEALIPAANRRQSLPAGHTVVLPAAMIFSTNVPRISLEALSLLLPDYVSPSEATITLSAAKLAASYALVEQVEITEPPAPEVVPPAAEELQASDPIPEEPVLLEEEVMLPPAPRDLAIPPPPRAVAAIPVAEELPAPLGEEMLAPSPKASARLSGLPIFRRRNLPMPPPPPPPPAAVAPEFVPDEAEPASPRLPQIRIPRALAASLTSEYPVPPAPVMPSLEDEAELPMPQAVSEIEVMAPVPLEETQALELAVEVPVTHAAPVETPEQESLQAVFLTEEALTVSRVLELCCELPGINSCVLSSGSTVIEAWNVPDGLDLVSMSSHAAEMLEAMRASSARMGIGAVPAVTLHTTKGVMSFFHHDALTLLVFHRDRGFVPGVREKMIAALDGLLQAGMTLPAGREV